MYINMQKNMYISHVDISFLGKFLYKQYFQKHAEKHAEYENFNIHVIRPHGCQFMKKA
jgi:hypothetical protein